MPIIIIIQNICVINHTGSHKSNRYYKVLERLLFLLDSYTILNTVFHNYNYSKQCIFCIYVFFSNIPYNISVIRFIYIKVFKILSISYL